LPAARAAFHSFTNLEMSAGWAINKDASAATAVRAECTKTGHPTHSTLSLAVWV